MRYWTWPVIALPTRIPRNQSPCAGLTRARLRVGRIEHVVRIDVQPAGPTELIPHVDEAAFLIEDLDPGVASVTHEQATPRVHGERMGLHELALTVSHRAPVVQIVPVTLRDEDVPVRSHEHIVGLEEVVRPPTTPRHPERHAQLPLGAEFENLMARDHGGARRRRSATPTGGNVVSAIGDPDIPGGIDVDAVGPVHQTRNRS